MRLQSEAPAEALTMVSTGFLPFDRKVELRLKSFTVFAERQANKFSHRNPPPKGGLPQPFVLIGREGDWKARLLRNLG